MSAREEAQPSLVLTAHCFFSGTCSHVESGAPDVVDAAMERHYATHEKEILAALNGARVLGVVRR